MIMSSNYKAQWKEKYQTLFWPQVELVSLAFSWPEISHDSEIMDDREEIKVIPAPLCDLRTGTWASGPPNPVQ